jgi:uncharacterized protein (TIGR03382 family)
MRNLVAGLLGLVLTAKIASATFHIMKITEVFPGTMAQPNAQFVELEMYAPGQNFVATHSVVVYDAAGTAVGTYTFAASVANGANQSTILIATTQAATLFGVTPDLTMTATIPLAAGMVCFDNIDCVAWGNFNGTPPAPAQVGRPAYQVKGLIKGRSLTRSLKGDTVLDGSDDTDVSADDFKWTVPSPKNNAGTVGTNPGSTCGNNTIEGLESCDDNNTASNDGCSAQCVTESCGDGITQTGEQCDDTNASNSDACSTTCTVQTPAPDDPALDGPPPQDAPTNPNNGDGGGGCCQTGGPGAAPGFALLVLGLVLRRRRAR